MSDLKPCPSCGDSTAVSVHRLAKQWCVSCSLCGVEVVVNTWNCTTTCQVAKRKIQAIEAWNSRPIEEQLRAELEEYKEAIKGALEIKDLWLPNVSFADCPPEDINEIDALHMMAGKFELLLEGE